MLKQFNNPQTWLVVIWLIISSCSVIDKEKVIKIYSKVPDCPKNIDIPRYKQSGFFYDFPFSFWHWSKQKEKQLGLQSAECSNDSLIFRVWISNFGSKKHQPHGLIEIRRDSLSFYGKLILFYVDFNEREMTEVVTESTSFDLTPLKSNWSSIVDSLKAYKFDELPTDEFIPGYYKQDEGYLNNSTTYSFEYATRECYRFYQYNQFYVKVDEFWQARSVSDILHLLNKEFEWDRRGWEYFNPSSK